jgi:hypothetical protein
LELTWMSLLSCKMREMCVCYKILLATEQLTKRAE